MSGLDPEDLALLRNILEVASQTRDASLRAASASELALEQLRTLHEIVAREVTPLGPFRADLIRRLEEHYNTIGQARLDVAELDQWRKDHDEAHRLAANGGG